MKIKQIETTFLSRYHTIDRLFRKIIKSQDAEDIRKFRIEVKKLRAFLDLLAHADGVEKPVILSKKIDAFYDAIGELRSFQLQYKLVRMAFKDRYSILPVNYLALLEHRITSACRITSRFKKRKPQVRKVIADVLGKRIETGNKITAEFARVKIKVMNELLHPFFPGDETLHAIRKVLKDVIHNWPYIKRVAAVKNGFSVFNDVDNMKLIARLLGKFQDKSSALALLNQFDPKKEGNKPGKIFLRDLEKKWKDEKEALRETVSRAIHINIGSVRESTLLLPAHHPLVLPQLFIENQSVFTPNP